MCYASRALGETIGRELVSNSAGSHAWGSGRGFNAWPQEPPDQEAAGLRNPRAEIVLIIYIAIHLFVRSWHIELQHHPRAAHSRFHRSEPVLHI